MFSDKKHLNLIEDVFKIHSFLPGSIVSTNVYRMTQFTDVIIYFLLGAQ